MKADTTSKNTKPELNKKSFDNFLKEDPDAFLRYVNMNEILVEQRKLFEQILAQQANYFEARENQILNTLGNLVKEIIQKLPGQNQQPQQQVLKDESSTRLSNAYSSFAHLNPAQVQNFSTEVELNDAYNLKLKEIRQQQSNQAK